MPLVYISIEQALEIHRKTVEISGGGSTGILDHGKLESVLANIQNDDYYPEFTDKITHLFFCANKFHCFQDGNKRVAITLARFSSRSIPVSQLAPLVLFRISAR